MQIVLDLAQIAEEALAAMEADCSCSHRNHCLGRKAKPHNMYKVTLQLF